MTDVLADQFVGRQSQDSRGPGIGIQAMAFVIHDEDSVEYILEDGGEFTICISKCLVSVPMLSSETPE